jgi:hypothetical protein
MSSDKSARSARSTGNSEYDNVYLIDNPMYQVFSVLLCDEEGNNICHHINRLVSAIETNNSLLGKFLAANDSDKRHMRNDNDRHKDVEKDAMSKDAMATSTAASSTVAASIGGDKIITEHKKKKRVRINASSNPPSSQ